MNVIYYFKLNHSYLVSTVALLLTHYKYFLISFSFIDIDILHTIPFKKLKTFWTLTLFRQCTCSNCKSLSIKETTITFSWYPIIGNESACHCANTHCRNFACEIHSTLQLDILKSLMLYTQTLKTVYLHIFPNHVFPIKQSNILSHAAL